MVNKFVLLALLIAIISGCNGGKNIQTDRPYQELGRAQHFNLDKPGYIVGIEKRRIKISDIEFLPGLNSNTAYTKRFSPLPETDEINIKRNEKFISVTTGQEKVMLVTQITKKFSNQEYLYNSYEQDLKGVYNYETSFDKIDVMFADLTEQLQKVESPYTHVLILCMGWNNDQVESLWRYNKILKNISLVANKNEEAFRPLVIALTWPSAWATISDSWFKTKLGHILSYPNKANDADEIGYTWVNWITNHKLPAAIEAANLSKKPKIVMVAHSFGVRLLSRALFSSDYLKSKYKHSNSVDLFIGLQGAVSGRRFVVNSGNEGFPYSDFKALPTKIVLTASMHDKANPFAYWITGASNVGAKQGLELAEKHPEVFDVEKWVEGKPSIGMPTDRILMVDASSIVNDNNDLKVSAHNDILDKEMGELLWNFIRRIP